VKYPCPCCRTKLDLANILKLSYNNYDGYCKYVAKIDETKYKSTCKTVDLCIGIAAVILIGLQIYLVKHFANKPKSAEFDSKIHETLSITSLFFNIFTVLILQWYNDMNSFPLNSFMVNNSENPYRNRYTRVVPLLITIIINLILTIYFTINLPKTSHDAFLYNGFQLSFPVGWYVLLLIISRGKKEYNAFYNSWTLILFMATVGLQIAQIYQIFNDSVNDSVNGSNYEVWLKVLSIVLLIVYIIGGGYIYMVYDEMLDKVAANVIDNCFGFCLTATVMTIYLISSVARYPINELDKSLSILLPHVPLLFILICTLYKQHMTSQVRKFYGRNLAILIFLNYLIGSTFNVIGPSYCFGVIDPSLRNSESCHNKCNTSSSIEKYGTFDRCVNGCAVCSSSPGSILILVTIYCLVGFVTNLYPIIIFARTGYAMKNEDNTSRDFESLSYRFWYVIGCSMLTLCGVGFQVMMIVVHRSGLINNIKTGTQFGIYLVAIFPGLTILFIIVCTIPVLIIILIIAQAFIQIRAFIFSNQCCQMSLEYFKLLCLNCCFKNTKLCFNKCFGGCYRCFAYCLKCECLFLDTEELPVTSTKVSVEFDYDYDYDYVINKEPDKVNTDYFYSDV
jgi:hypothetical protein